MLMKERSVKAYLMLISAMLIFGTIGIFRRYIPLSSGMLAFSRGLLGSAFLFVFIRARGGKWEKIAPAQIRLLLLSGSLIGLNWILLFEAYNYTTVATATMCYYMEPTLVILLSPLVLQEKMTAKRLLCTLASIGGMVCISGLLEGGGAGGRDIRGIACGLGAAALYASVVILNKKTRVDNAYQKTCVQLTAATVVLIPYLLLTENWAAIRLDGRAVLMVLAVGIVHTGIAYTLYFGSMKGLKAQSIAVLSYIDPVFALILSTAVLHEKMSPLGVIGSALIIGSALVSEISVQKRKSSI